MVYNNSLFLILTRNAFPSPSIHISDNEVLFIGKTYWTNVVEGIIDRNALIVSVLFF